MKKFSPYLVMIGSLIAVVALFQILTYILPFVPNTNEHTIVSALFIISILFSLSFIVFYVSQGTPLPAFVIAIFFGIAAHGFLANLIAHTAIIHIIVGLGATLILFAGGLETPFTHFKSLSGSILSLSFIGLGITAYTLSVTITHSGSVLHLAVPSMVALLLGAVLASTDPAAIIPTLKLLRFKHPELKHIIISESALTDVSGTLLTITFLGVIAQVGTSISIGDGYRGLISTNTLIFLLQQVGLGMLLGFFGFILLHILKRFKSGHTQEFDVDSAVFLCIPIFIFTLATAFGGSGYLAAFIAGLLFHISDHLRDTERFFNHLIDGFFKPTIFILLGAMVDIRQLFAYAAIGISVALIFIFIIRPLTVFISLAPFMLKRQYPFDLRDIIFMSWIRETGAIPAVLLVTISAMGIPHMESLVPIGTWIILLTLTIQPALTPWVAKKLTVGECIRDEDTAQLHTTDEPVVVLATRGNSFLRRLPTVAEWASTHGIHKVVVLLCLEDKYSAHTLKEVTTKAQAVFDTIAMRFHDEQKPTLHFSILSRRGFLQKNLKQLAHEQQNISAFFVGKRMLDFRLEQIKQMNVPFYFMD